LGLVESAWKHLCFPGQRLDPVELQKFQLVEKHLSKCSDARKVNDWNGTLREAEASIAAGADYCPQLFMCRAEALLKLHQLEDSELSLSKIEMALGRFENAVAAAEKAGQIDPRNVEVAVLLNNVRLVARAQQLVGLSLDRWRDPLMIATKPLQIQPNYTKALLRRAASYSKLERWADAVRDYEVLRRELPDYNGVAESLFHAQVALKKSRGEEVYNMKFGGEVEEVLGFEQFRAATSLPCVSVVHFKSSSNVHCKQISPLVDTLCVRYPSINFLKVDMEEHPAIANAENVRIVPTFKIYKNGNRVKEIVCPSHDVLEHSYKDHQMPMT
ncbi:hypothetical protein OIU85_022455, partial [Salix viminalis]